MANVIRLGDPTSHGGKVTSSSAGNVKAGGIPMALVGDKVSCPIKGHTGCVITTGNSKHRINGVAVAYEGDKTSCGATLISTTSNFSAR
jgi:uncharacterized Zn-binding protein involved in type VI secretion